MLLSHVGGKLNFFIFEYKYIVRPIKRLEILPGMRIFTQNLHNSYVKRFTTKNIVKELYSIELKKILKRINLNSTWKW